MEFFQRTVNGLCYMGFMSLKLKGELEVTDKGETLALRTVLTHLLNPKNRYLNLKGRTNSPYATIAEIFWVMSGSNRLDPWLSSFLHRAKLYSDDGETWYSAYGPRLYENNQLGGVIYNLKKSKATRQAVLSIYNPEKESVEGMLKHLGKDYSLDKSCNNILYFSYDKEGKLNLAVSNRSNDVIFGAYSINLPEFTFLQEFVASYLEEDYELGEYSVFSNNYHTYRAVGEAEKLGNGSAQKQFEAVIELNDPLKLVYEEDCNLVMDIGVLRCEDISEGMEKTKQFFTTLISILGEATTESRVPKVSKFLTDHKIKEGTVIWAYSMALCGYLDNKDGIKTSLTPTMLGNDEIFIKWLEDSKFTKFDIL